jgi:hypothetical protein
MDLHRQLQSLLLDLTMDDIISTLLKGTFCTAQKFSNAKMEEAVHHLSLKQHTHQKTISWEIAMLT